MGHPKSVLLTVKYHRSDRYTLTECYDGQSEEQCNGTLLANSNKGDFYQAVAQKIADLGNSGFKVVYKDKTP